MRRAFDVVGTKVIHVPTGELVGRVHDLLFNREGCLQGLSLEKKYWFVKAPYIPISQILSIGEDVVTVNSLPSLNVDCIEQDWLYLNHGQRKIKGVPVITSNGKQLGILEDVYFQEEMGTIIGYELSDGFFSDLMEGRRIIRKPNKLSIGKDAFVIHQAEKEDRIQ